jgi:predicted nucleic acid-binding protein
MLVVDSSVAVAACLGEAAFQELGDGDLVAPPLLWPETRSALHLARWFGRLTDEVASGAVRRLEAAPVRMRNPARLGPEAWRLADLLGWARTYDAEYAALAYLFRCRCVTVDGRFRRGADRLGFVVTPEEL